jgi:hypothetical protein
LCDTLEVVLTPGAGVRIIDLSSAQKKWLALDAGSSCD